MNSVMHRQRLSQRLIGSFAILSLSVAAFCGCRPGAATSGTKDAAPGKRPAANSAKKTPATDTTMPKEPSPEIPVKDLPGVETPVQDLPNPPSKAPATKETSAPKKPGGESSAAISSLDSDLTPNQVPVRTVSQTKETSNAAEPSLEPAVKWLPKPADNPAAEAKDQQGMKPYTETLTADVKLDMVPIPGGAFKMGSPSAEKDRNADEGPQVNVKLDPFWMGKYEMTWAQYELWGMGLDKQRRNARQVTPTSWDTLADALAIPTKPYSDMTFGMGKDGYPAICMTQFAAKMYCKWLSAKTGHYYRLPTEAEWEYACRAGTTGPYSFGKDPEKLGGYAWSSENSDEKYHKVGKKKPNPWGLYDMHGNVAEWCVDQYYPDRYKQLGDKPEETPVTSVTKAYPQVARGGAWTDEAPLLRSAARRASSKDWKAQDPQIPKSVWYHTDAPFVGFRVVRPLRVPTPEEAARYDITEYEKQEFLDYRKAQAGKQ
jgi:formylglycine-generating enzyme required for sulfatase activity